MNIIQNVELFSLFKEIEPFIKFKKFFGDLKVSFTENSLPDHFLDLWQRDNAEVFQRIKLKDEKNYCDLFLKNNQLFERIDEINIDRLALSMYKKFEKHEGNISLLNTFKSGDRIEYTRNETVSGRLTVKSGPKLLNLPKKYRNILKSRFAEGEIVMVDFKSLEPRVAKYILSKNEILNDDIYQDLISQLSFNIDRVVMKRAVISILYGMSEETMQIGELAIDKIREIRQCVLKYFKIADLLELSLQKNKSGSYQTYFGRPIYWDNDVQLHQVLNGYIQGTAVDVALSGFLELTNHFNNEMIPIGLIHDAILIDVEKNSKNKFVKLIENGYNFKDLGQFTFSIETISQRKI